MCQWLHQRVREKKLTIFCTIFTTLYLTMHTEIPRYGTIFVGFQALYFKCFYYSNYFLFLDTANIYKLCQAKWEMFFFRRTIKITDVNECGGQKKSTISIFFPRTWKNRFNFHQCRYFSSVFSLSINSKYTIYDDYIVKSTIFRTLRCQFQSVFRIE